MVLKALLCVLAISACVNANSENDTIERVLIEDIEIARGKVIAPSVVGCAIKSKPGLYKFMLDIWGLYHNIEYESNDDIEPQIIFYNYKNEVLKFSRSKDISSISVHDISRNKTRERPILSDEVCHWFFGTWRQVLFIVVTKIKNKTADEISAILDEAGFYKRSEKGEEVPKEFQHFPLKAPRDEL